MEKINIGLTIRQVSDLVNDIIKAFDEHPVNSDVMNNIINEMRQMRPNFELECKKVVGLEEFEKLDIVRDAQFYKIYCMLEEQKTSEDEEIRNSAEVLFKIIDGEKYDNYLSFDCQKKDKLGSLLMSDFMEVFEELELWPEILYQFRNFAMSVEAFYEEATKCKLPADKMQSLQQTAAMRYDTIWYLNGKFREYINSNLEMHPVFFTDFCLSLDKIIAKYNSLSA